MSWVSRAHWSHLGRIETYFGDKDIGRDYLEEGLAIFQKSGDKSGIANVLSAMGLAELYSEDIEKSREHYEEALKISRELRNGPGSGVALIALGEIARSQSDYAAARSYYEEALKLNEHLGQMGIVSIVAHNLGYVASQQGEFEKALAYFQAEPFTFHQARSAPFYLFLPERDRKCDGGPGKTVKPLRGSLAAPKMLGSTGHFELDPVDRWEVNQSLKKLDQVIDEKEKARLWEEGRAMAVEDVIKLAMNEEKTPSK